jgi:hypothetical protein
LRVTRPPITRDRGVDAFATPTPQRIPTTGIAEAVLFHEWAFATRAGHPSSRADRNPTRRSERGVYRA